ncbi:hypothetical protein [Marivita sp.]|nr:hypothetical protein [Marivita sp.]
MIGEDDWQFSTLKRTFVRYAEFVKLAPSLLAALQKFTPEIG